jgi:3-hydroxyisobutyrate dehydrogenase-like beta-hydroxyacid dehydrogenase
MDRWLGIIGFGEAGSTFAQAAGWKGLASAYDVDPARNPIIAKSGLIATDTALEALKGAQLVLSLVTADQALSAAESYAKYLRPETIWCDMNSIAPKTKQQAAKVVEASGAHYVDVAVLAPVHPARMKVPLLISGPQADNAADALLQCGFSNVRIVGPDVGRASAIKMIRSVMVKGIEALTDEMMAAATAAGVIDEVLASLDASEKNQSWTTRATNNLERMSTHGLRRATEMEESAATLRALGVEPVMTEGTARRQREAAAKEAAKKDAA